MRVVRAESTETASRRRLTATGLPAEPERILMACLAKNRQDRPLTAIELDRLLARLDPAPLWIPEDARLWRQVNLPSSAPAVEEEPEPGTGPEGSARS